ncbi:uncharacterized protein LOC142563902 isoform X2 [Dermacentor variabilis]|uniref:uncharacterized protein LOC142563902 isoform X2 n=1 Tax=Dermacentor variabilis TaxID=34621 RepID=UPI003F5AF335
MNDHHCQVPQPLRGPIGVALASADPLEQCGRIAAVCHRRSRHVRLAAGTPAPGRHDGAGHHGSRVEAPGGGRGAQPGVLGALRRLLGYAAIPGGRDPAVHPAREVGADQELPQAHHQAAEGGARPRRHRAGVQGARTGSADEGGRGEAEAAPRTEQDRRLQVPEPEEGADRASVRGIGRLAEGQRRAAPGAAEATSGGSASDVTPSTTRLHRLTGSVVGDRGLPRRWSNLPLTSPKASLRVGCFRANQRSAFESQFPRNFAYTGRSL